jgi:hypothetical protein
VGKVMAIGPKKVEKARPDAPATATTAAPPPTTPPTPPTPPPPADEGYKNPYR